MSRSPASPERPLRRRLRRLGRLASPSERTVLRAFRWLTAFAIAIANLVGTAIVFPLLVWVIPPGNNDSSAVVNLILASGYVLLAVTVGIAWAMRRLRPGRRWIDQGGDRPPEPEEQA